MTTTKFPQFSLPLPLGDHSLLPSPTQSFSRFQDPIIPNKREAPLHASEDSVIKMPAGLGFRSSLQLAQGSLVLSNKTAAGLSIVENTGLPARRITSSLLAARYPVVLSNRGAALPSVAADFGLSSFEQMGLQSIRRSIVSPHIEAILLSKRAGCPRIATKMILSFHMRATRLSSAKDLAISTSKTATRLRPQDIYLSPPSGAARLSIKENMDLPFGRSAARLSITDNTGVSSHRRIVFFVTAQGLVFLVNKMAARLSVAEDTGL